MFRRSKYADIGGKTAILYASDYKTTFLISMPRAFDYKPFY